MRYADEEGGATEATTQNIHVTIREGWQKRGDVTQICMFRRNWQAAQQWRRWYWPLLTFSFHVWHILLHLTRSPTLAKNSNSVIA